MGVFGLDDRGAIGLGVQTVQTSPDVPVSNAVRFSGFVDLGTKLNRWISGGLEFQGAVARLSENNFALQSRDVSRYLADRGGWVLNTTSNNYQQSYTLTELDFGPRGYLSVEWDRQAQLQGFLGLNWNWQSLDYSIKNTSATTLTDAKGNVLVPGDTHHATNYLGQNTQLVVGGRMTVSVLYFELARYFNLESSGFSLSDNDLTRFGLGLNLRF